MTKTEAIALQEMMMQEAVAWLRVTDRNGSTALYETAIPLIGKVWDIPEEHSAKCIEVIGKEAAGTEVFEEEYLPMNALPIETIRNILALIDTAIRCNQLYECKALLALAQDLAATQNLVECIEGLIKIDSEDDRSVHDWNGTN